MPPNAAPDGVGQQLGLTSGTPIEAAATSSSRSAIQARPRRESRSRMLTNSTMSTMREREPVPGSEVQRVNGSTPGK